MSEDEGKRNDEVRRGLEAQAILENPLFIEAIAAVKQRILAEWQQSQGNESERRERLWLCDQMLTKITGILRKSLQTGKLADQQLDLNDRANGRATDI